MWRMRHVDVGEVMDSDRMHLNASGHQHMAIAVLDALGVPHDLEPDPPREVRPLARREQWSENVRWTREFLGPWVHRRVTGRSSGDGVTPKRPTLLPVD
jgi:hypothetical protein